MNEIEGQLPLFETGDTVVVRYYTPDAPVPVEERTYIEYTTWRDVDDED